MVAAVTTGAVAVHRSARRGTHKRPNWLGGLAGWLWLAVVLVPIYWIFITSVKQQSDYFRTNPFAPPASPTLANYALVIASNFPRYFANSVVVTVGAVVPAVLFSFMAAFAVVRGSGRYLRSVNARVPHGAGDPAAGGRHPRLPDHHPAQDVRHACWRSSCPRSRSRSRCRCSCSRNFIRDIPNELFESMRLDGASDWTMLWRLAFPLTRPALVTVTIYNGLTIWNSFLLPLILTQSPDQRTLPLALWSFQGQYSINVPAIAASVVLTTLPILILYAVGRRQLLSGLTAGFGK